jgi:acetoin utilization deacetylase AcuC-like enzyme
MSGVPLQIFYHPLSLDHDTGRGHPERSDRIRALLEQLKQTGLQTQLDWKTPDPASVDTIAFNHGRDYIELVEMVANGGGGMLDADTALSSASYDAALMASGACIQGVDAVINKDANRVFCMNRPPGHHARKSTAMGFCLFNSVAIGAWHALKHHGLDRVFIFDWDVHHGNGTQESFYEESSVFFCSIHQSPLYPGTGMTNETGKGAGEGTTLNLPVSSGAVGNDYRTLLNERVLPAMRDFQPDLIMISAGFDAHRRDPLAGVQLEDEDFGMLTREVMDVASEVCAGRVVSVLEGGYDLKGLAGGVEQHLRVLLGEG